MAQNKKNITPENLTEWLCSTGFLFPRNEMELARMEKLYSDEEKSHIDPNIVDPDRILTGGTTPKVINMNSHVEHSDITPYRMVARNGSILPEHILAKMKSNQQNKKNGDDNGSKAK